MESFSFTTLKKTLNFFIIKLDNFLGAWFNLKVARDKQGGLLWQAIY